MRLDHTDFNCESGKGFSANVSSGGVYFHPMHHDQHLSVNQVLSLSIISCRHDYKEAYLVKAHGKILRIDKSAASYSKIGVALQFMGTPSVW
jgi:hypothetical protein